MCVCVSAAADWDVFSAIKAFPHVSIPNLQELERPVDRSLNNVTREATATSSFNLKLKWKNEYAPWILGGGGFMPRACLHIHLHGFEKLRLKLDKH